MTFRKHFLVFICILVPILVITYFYSLPLWISILVIITYLFELVLGVINIQANYFIESINELPSDKYFNQHKSICLSFDDGVHAELTPKVLDILKAANIKAMFFIIGKHIKGNELILKRMFDEGHVIGNHSFTHDFWFDMKSAKEMSLDIDRMNNLVEKEIGFKPIYFRPPYGVTNPNIAKAIITSDMKSVGWSLRSKDTVAKSKAALLSKLIKLTKPGAIVLLHDRCEVTVDILTDYIAYCKQQGYTFATI